MKKTLLRYLNFKRLNKYRVKVNFEKCQFYCASVQFLGHKIDYQGVHPDNNKMDAIRNAPYPNDVVQSRFKIVS